MDISMTFDVDFLIAEIQEMCMLQKLRESCQLWKWKCAVKLEDGTIEYVNLPFSDVTFIYKLI